MLRVSGSCRVGCGGAGDVATLGLHGCTCAEEVGVAIGCDVLANISYVDESGMTYHHRAW